MKEGHSMHWVGMLTKEKGYSMHWVLVGRHMLTTEKTHDVATALQSLLEMQNKLSMTS